MPPNKSHRELLISGAPEESDSDQETSSMMSTSEDAFADAVVWEGARNRHRAKWLQWLFHDDTNPAYADDMGLSLREATVLVVIVLSEVISNDHNPIYQAAGVRLDLPFGVALMYTFTLCKTFGETLEAARSSWFGTFLSVSNTWIMSIIFKAMQQGDSALEAAVGNATNVTATSVTSTLAPVTTLDNADPIWYLTMADGILFITAVMLLDFNMNTRIFAITSFVYNWMRFLKTESASAIELSMTNPETKELIAALLACLLAILTSLLPHPIMGISKAGILAVELAGTLDGTWKACAEYLVSTAEDVDQTDKVRKKIRALKGAVLDLDAKLDIAAWETPFMPGRFRAKRLMLRSLVTVLREGYDRLLSVERSCSEEDFGASHAAVMASIKHEVHAAVETSSNLFALCVKAALDGTITRKEAALLKVSVDQARATQKALTEATIKATARVHPNRVSKDLLDEHCFGFHLCAFSRMTVDYAEKLIEFEHSGEPPILEKLSSCNPCAMPDAAQVSFVARNLPTLWLGMVIGYFGYHEMIDEYDAGIACTTAVILQKFAGSTVQKTMGRLQGVVFGKLTGQLMYAFFAWCDPFAYLVIAVAVFAWSTMTCLTYHNQGSGIALLLVAYGTTGVSNQCSNTDITMPNVSPIINVVAALALALFVDTVLNSIWCLPEAFKMRRASTLARNKLGDGWESVKGAVRDIVDPSIREVREHKGTFLALLADIRMLGSEGAVEMRYHRAPWPKELFDQATETLAKVQITLSTLEHTASGGEEAGDKLDSYLKVIQLPSYRKLCDEVLSLFSEIISMLDIFSKEGLNEAEIKGAMAAMPSSVREKSYDTSMQKTFDEVATIQWSKSGGETLESDGPAVACVAIKSLNSMRSDLVDLRHHILSY